MLKTIKVTGNDIRWGRRWSNDSCPVARAVKRACPNSKVTVGRFTMYIDKTPLALPSIAIKFIEEFDSWQYTAPEPITFKLVIPDATCN